GLASLTQGEYEQASRELAPALMLGTLYAGGKGLRALSARGASGIGMSPLDGFRAMELRLRGLQEMARQLEATLGVEGLRELARDMRASREAARFVAAGGMDAALALREARGEAAKARPLLSQARPAPGRPTHPMAGARTSSGSTAPVPKDAAGTSQKKAGAGGTLGGEVIADRRVLRVLEQIRERAAAGTFRRAANYHAHFSEARVLEILRNPDAIYESTGRAGKLIYRQGGDIVVVDGPGSGNGQVITGYGPSGIRAESGARALGGAPADPGTPVTHEMITGGTIPVSPKSPKLPAAIQIWPPSGGSP
ncbi:MAG TPA: hypothetical protein VLQ93_04940, partial [Myxococcaceae bacterium]|nr:hypothetical protein [Myxococcaceae bacterium]